jgi:hypothetical protein
MTENERFGLVFEKTGSINSSIDIGLHNSAFSRVDQSSNYATFYFFKHKYVFSDQSFASPTAKFSFQRKMQFLTHCSRTTKTPSLVLL